MQEATSARCRVVVASFHLNGQEALRKSADRQGRKKVRPYFLIPKSVLFPTSEVLLQKDRLGYLDQGLVYLPQGMV